MMSGNRSSSQQLELVCPTCGFRQVEPARVISTLCRRCGEHLSVRDGKVVLRQQPRVRIAERKQVAEPGRRTSEPGSTALRHASARTSQVDETGLVGIWRRLTAREPARRQVLCYHCGTWFEVLANAESSQCIACGGHVSLREYRIAEPWRRRIQTRGNVIIERDGSIEGVHVQCHDLLVLGSLRASVECSGKLTIRSHGRIIGKLQCTELRVERGAHVEFHGGVEAVRVWIDGEVKAQIVCKETITLEKKAHLQGPIIAAGLVVKEGARHSGSMQVVKQSTAG